MYVSSIERPSYLRLNNDYTNLGFRIANLIHIMEGKSEYAMLAYYSDHMEQFLDEIETSKEENIVLDGETNMPAEHIIEHKELDRRILRGAIGPRIRNWVGSHQLQEANNINSTLDDQMEFVKPEGVDQLKSAFEDLNAHDMEYTTVMVRDPAIDFDVSNNIPDLSLINFTICKSTLIMSLMYQEVSLTESNMLNEIWALQFIGMAFSKALKKSRLDIQIVSSNMNAQVPTIFDDNIPKENHFTENIDEFLSDLIILGKVENAVRNIYRPESFTNENVGIEYLSEMIEESFFDDFKLDICKDMAYCLIIFGLSKGGTEYLDNMKGYAVKIKSMFFEEEAKYFIEEVSSAEERKG